jgi:hypothetical protein
MLLACQFPAIVPNKNPFHRRRRKKYTVLLSTDFNYSFEPVLFGPSVTVIILASITAKAALR